MMPIAARLINRLTTELVDVQPFRVASRNIRGWSRDHHYIFFRHLVAMPIRSVLVNGVYRGLDLHLLQLAATSARKELSITGVDLFSAEPCADWTDEQRARGTWEANGFGPPPDMAVAQANAPGATVIKSDSVGFMQTTQERFDCVYLDTSHDEATVRAEIEASRRVLNPGGLLCGDDYIAQGGWGVDLAVQALVPHHAVLFGSIWLET